MSNKIFIRVGGMAAGMTALVRFVVLSSGGGDWVNLPESLAPVVFILYMTATALALVWLLWTGILLLRRKA